ncbi:hydroxyacylglutathione hydrolase [Microbulbifer aggregans]|uniref:hydroxyacylglutathione hydrolase n=1 Tax=Microbulbifer aggregans TaxID=1769779 RepID=UPI001CFF3F78|nr:hydroxyacylglutathione hydrolase [Microbulbifer aggregans]
MITISPIPAFNDNYIWRLTRGREHWVVDPGDAKPVVAALGHETLSGILVTHHHFDHTGGISALIDKYNCPVIGPQSIDGVTQPVQGGGNFSILGVEASVVSVPGHTLDHIAYIVRESGKTHLFCGDTLFAAGCGRLFEGSPDQMYQSLGKLTQLPDDTLIYCAHEYTLANLHFAASVEPGNTAILQRQNAAQALRDQQKPTLPSNMQLEKETNPFLRCNQGEVRVQAELHGAAKQSSPVEIFATLRHWKDTF